MTAEPEHPLVTQLRKLLLKAPKAKRWTRRKYKRYLKGLWWQKKRAEKLTSQSYKCEKCGAPATEVHHKHYNSIGRESDEDLVAICRPCHEKEHPRKRRKRR